MRTPPLIKTRDLTVKFAEGRDGVITALDIDAFTLNPAELICITGPSGSGKSTMLYTLAGIMVPDSGFMFWDGDNVFALSTSKRAKLRLKLAGLIFQNIYLIPELSVIENVLLSVTFDHFIVPKRLRERAIELLERFKVPQRKRAGDLSAGEQQRAALARALLHEPLIILADEPTANLDLASSKIVLDELALINQQGASVVIVSHDPLAIERFTNQVNLVRGRIAT